MSLDRNKQLALQSFDVIKFADRALAEQLIAPTFQNFEADDDADQPARQQRGP